MPSGRQGSTDSGPAFPLLFGQILVPERIRPHSTGPVRTRHRYAFADFVSLLDAAIKALGPDDRKKGGWN